MLRCGVAGYNVALVSSDSFHSQNLERMSDTAYSRQFFQEVFVQSILKRSFNNIFISSFFEHFLQDPMLHVSYHRRQTNSASSLLMVVILIIIIIISCSSKCANKPGIATGPGAAPRICPLPLTLLPPKNKNLKHYIILTATTHFTTCIVS